MKKDDFLWGSATASYQCEGAWDKDGKGLSMWDDFCHNSPFNLNGSNGDIASDFYHHYREDLKMLKDGGQNTFRFSLSWPRILPNGTGEINEDGIRFYRNVLTECHKLGIVPNVTLYHWDLPKKLQDNGGWENRETAYAFEKYANVCFDAFKDLVELWVTINEPSYFILSGYAIGNYPPNVKDFYRTAKAGYHVQLASALATNTFRKGNYPGEIGIVHASSVVDIVDQSIASKIAQRKADNYFNNWVLDPPFLGKFPEDFFEDLVKKGIELDFIMENDNLIFKNGIVDFCGINYYSRSLIRAAGEGELLLKSNNLGIREEINEPRVVVRIPGWFEMIEDPDSAFTQWDMEIYPEGLTNTLIDVKKKYGDIPIYLTENGVGMHEKLSNNTVEDDGRIDFMESHINALLKAKDLGIDVRGYYVWSTMDLYSWVNGYQKRYGLVYVDFDNHQKRYPKKSYYWYRDFILNYQKKEESNYE